MYNMLLKKYLSTKIVLIWVIGIILNIVSASIQIYLPDTFKLFINSAVKLNFQGVNLTEIVRWVIILLIISCLSSIFIGYSSERAMFNLRNNMFKRILDINLNDIEMSISEISNRLTNDTEVLGRYLSTTVPNLIKSGLVFIGSVVGLMILNLKLASTLLILLMIFLVILNVFGYFISKLGTMFKDESAKYLGTLINHLNNWRIIKVERGENFIFFRQQELAKKLFNISFKAILFQTIALPVQFIFLSLIGLVLFFVIARQLQDGEISPGDITAILLYLLNIVNSVGDLGQSFFDFQQDKGQLVGLRKLGENIDKIQIDKIEYINDREICLQVNNASVNMGEKIIFSNITKNFKFNNYYIIKGRNGAGKTTFVLALLQLQKLSSGNIKVSSYAKISYVPQKPKFFIGTVLDNLTFGRNIDEQKIINILKKVNLWEDLDNMGGLNYFLNEKNGLSGGQLQKLAIARSLLHNANVLILDEITSNLDTESKIMIRNVLFELSNEVTIIEISHINNDVNNAEELILD